jgi:phage shock protein A
MRLFARLSNLVRGVLGRWLGEREHRNPGAVYESAIQERVVQYAKLREAAAGVIYMRQKLERELASRSEELGRVRRQLDVAVERDDDTAALALIGRRDALDADVARLTQDLGELTTEADAAKRNLVRDGGDPALEKRLGTIRDAEAERAARAQLDELKRARKATLVPMVLTPVQAAAAR